MERLSHIVGFGTNGVLPLPQGNRHFWVVHHYHYHIGESHLMERLSHIVGFGTNGVLPLPPEEAFPLERAPTTTTCGSVVSGIDALLPPLRCALLPPAIHLMVPLSHYVRIRLIDASAGLGTTTTTGELSFPLK